MDEDKEIQRLIKILGNPNYKKWAFEKLVKIGRPALPQLVEALKDKNGNVRENAAELLRKIVDERDIPAFIEALKDNQRFSKVGPTACHALAEIGEPAVPHLIEALNDKDIRYRAVGILGNIAEKRTVDILRHFAEKEVDCSAAVPVLIGFLKSGNSHQRWTTASTLGKIGDERAVPALIAALEDEDLSVRRRAVEALGKIDDKRGEVDSVVPALCGAMKDEDEVVRRYASEELGKISDERAVSALVDALNDKDEGVRIKATSALIRICDEKAIPYFIDALKESSHVQSKVAMLLRRIAEKGVDCSAAVPALIEVLFKADEFDVEWEVAESLGKIGDIRAVPALICAIKGNRHTASDALVMIAKNNPEHNWKEDVIVLIDTLKDTDQYMREGAALALDGITEKIADEGNYLTALEIIKERTSVVRKMYEGKKGRDSLKERKKVLGKLAELTQQIHDKMNSVDRDKKTFPIKRQEVRKPPARFLRT